MRRLRFLHIPKTAGSTLTAILARQYAGLPRFDFEGVPAGNEARYQALSEQERRALVLFAGHSPIRTGIQDADAATLITLLRDPVARVKSFCQHVYEGKSPYLTERFPAASFDLEGFLRSGNVELANLQTKMLINSQWCATTDLLNRLSPSAARDLALENLFHQVAWFGLQEYFDESVRLFAVQLHWKEPQYESLNTRDSTRLLEFKDRHIQLIAEMNAIDQAVYQAAHKRFLEILETLEESATATPHLGPATEGERETVWRRTKTLAARIGHALFSHAN